MSHIQASLRRVICSYTHVAQNALGTLASHTKTIYGTGLVICLLLQGFAFIKPLSLPVMAGDNIFTLNYAKNYLNGNGFRINPNLGFPGVQDNLFFPSFDFSYRLFLRIVGTVATEVATSYYLLYLAGVCAMFTATAFALRSLEFRHPLVAIGSIVYVVSPYFVFRSLNHDFLALYFSAPLGAALALRIGKPLPGLTTRQFFAEPSVALSLGIIATSGLYYAFFSILFTTFVGVVASLSQRRHQPALIAAICALIVFPLLVATGFGSGLIEVLTGKGNFVRRFAFEQLDYGLTLAEAMHVFANLGPLNSAYIQYVSIRPHLSYAAGLEEWPGILLTAIILGSPLFAAVIGASPKERSKWINLIFLSATLIVFGIIYSVNGGLAYYFNAFVSPTIRATARVMPFLSFFALIILLATVEILLLSKSWSARWAVFCLIALLTVCMMPTVGKFALKQKLMIANPTIQNDLQSVRALLAEKNRAGLTAMLQLPHVQWPEAGPIRAFEPYSLMKYFILDAKGSTTSWSYGGSSNQESFVAINDLVEQHRQSGLSVAARQLGFDGIVVEKLAYEQAAVSALSRNIEMSGGCKLFEDIARLLYTLKLSSCKPAEGLD